MSDQGTPSLLAVTGEAFSQGLMKEQANYRLSPASDSHGPGICGLSAVLWTLVSTLSQSLPSPTGLTNEDTIITTKSTHPSDEPDCSVRCSISDFLLPTSSYDSKNEEGIRVSLFLCVCMSLHLHMYIYI